MSAPASGEVRYPWREPVAWVAIAVAVGYMLITFYQIVNEHTSLHNWPSAFRYGEGNVLTVPMLLVLVATALACVLLKPVTAKARQILGVTALLLVVGAVLEVVFTVIGLTARVGNDAVGVVFELIGAILPITLKLVGAWVLWQIRKGRTAAPAVAETVTRQPEPELDQGPAPSWEPEQAFGQVWTRAGDAATGARASAQGQQGGARWSVGTPQIESAAPARSASGSPVGPATAPGPWRTAAQQAAGTETSSPAGQAAGNVPSQSAGTGWQPASRPTASGWQAASTDAAADPAAAWQPASRNQDADPAAWRPASSAGSATSSWQPVGADAAQETDAPTYAADAMRSRPAAASPQDTSVSPANDAQDFADQAGGTGEDTPAETTDTRSGSWRDRDWDPQG